MCVCLSVSNTAVQTVQTVNGHQSWTLVCFLSVFPGFWFERHEQQDGEPVSEASQVDGSLLDVVVVVVVTLVPC